MRENRRLKKQSAVTNHPSIHPRADPKQLRNYVYYDARCDDGSPESNKKQ